MDKINKILRKLPPSVVFLVAVNLIPLFGVIFWGWKVFPIMILFWFENIIIGVFFILRILTIGLGANSPPSLLYRLFGALFFTAHYGIFVLGHLVFIFVLFSPPDFSADIEMINSALMVSIIESYQLTWVLIGLFLSHGFSYISNYLFLGESQRTSIIRLSIRPYLRVAILHVTIIIGGMVVIALNQPLAGMIFLLIIKIIIDCWTHLVEHEALPNSFDPKNPIQVNAP